MSFNLSKINLEVAFDPLLAAKNSLGLNTEDISNSNSELSQSQSQSSGSSPLDGVEGGKSRRNRKVLNPKEKQLALLHHGRENVKQALFCSEHSSSDKRPKGAHREVSCEECQSRLQTNYVSFYCCPSCRIRV